MDPNHPLERTLAGVRRRLVARRLLEGGLHGLVVGVALAGVGVVGLGRLVPPDRLPALGVPAAVAVLALAVVTGASTALLHPGLRRVELAQLLDRRLGTEEVWVTAAWLVRTPDTPHRAERLATLEPLLGAPAPRTLLPLRIPWGVRLLPLLTGLLVGAFFLPGPSPAGSPGPTIQEGERLQERLAAIEEATEAAPLPESIEAEVASLADDLERDLLTPDDALERIEALQEALDAHSERLEPTTDLLDELERAADALAEQPDLAEALRSLDPEQADAALQELAQNAGDSEEIARSLEEAAEALADSPDPGLRDLAERLQQSSESLEQGNPNLEGLREAIEQNRELGERIEQDKRALERAQRTNGALEASRQRLEEQAARDGQDGQASEGEGQGERTGDPTPGGEGGQPADATSPGVGHTWEDQGSSDRRPDLPHEDRTSDRTATAEQHIDDFERLYAPSRLQDVDALLAVAPGTLDERGEIELVPMRRTHGDERAERPLVDVPDAYTEAARDAIDDETVPPGYRDAVRRYFDQLE